MAALAIDPTAPARIYAVLAGAGVYRSDDGAVVSGKPFREYRSTDGPSFGLRYTAPSSIYNPWLVGQPRS